ncbi:MAG: archaellin/type IV pilin N-terminal domain-containing protein [Thermoplasmata archaeon]
MRVLYKKEKGVSPVIATILMVAITVVLASAVYLMVSGYIGSAPSKPVAMSFTVTSTSTNTQFLVVSGNISVTSSTPLIITVTNSSGTWTYKATSLSYSSWTSLNPSGAVSFKITTVTGHQYLSAGDIITFTTAIKSPPTSPVFPLYPGTTVTFTYQGTVIYKYTV